MTITFYSQFWQPGFGKSGIQSSNGQPSVSHNLINVGSQGSNPLFVEDDYLYKFSDDYMDVDDYAYRHNLIAWICLLELRCRLHCCRNMT
jgi:hypothetical protein